MTAIIETLFLGQVSTLLDEAFLLALLYFNKFKPPNNILPLQIVISAKTEIQRLWAMSREVKFCLIFSINLVF